MYGLPENDAWNDANEFLPHSSTIAMVLLVYYNTWHSAI